MRYDRLWFLDTVVTIRASEHDGTNGISVLEHRAPFGHSPPLHVHRNEDEIFHVLTGELRVHVDGRDIEVRAGDTLLAPRDVPHTLVVESVDGATYLTVTARGDFERMVRAIGRPPGREAMPPSLPPTSEQIAALQTICAANGIDILGAPLRPSRQAA